MEYGHNKAIGMGPPWTHANGSMVDPCQLAWVHHGSTMCHLFNWHGSTMCHLLSNSGRHIFTNPIFGNHAQIWLYAMRVTISACTISERGWGRGDSVRRGGGCAGKSSVSPTLYSFDLVYNSCNH